MTNNQKDNLFILIKSLNKSEKRQFKVFANRIEANNDSKFLQLFDLLEKMKTYDEKLILKSNIVSKLQLSNLKAHLYKQILISLKLNPQNQNIRTQLREQLDFATILYNKGLYKQALKILDKAKEQALEHEEKFIAYEIIELEKVIESQYITRSISSRADELAIQAKDINRLNVVTSKLSNLSLQLYSTILKTGYAKSDEDMKIITQYFNARLPKVKVEELEFREKLWWYKSHFWHSYLIQDFLSCFKFANKWVELFYSNENLINDNPVWFLKGASHLLECLYLIKYKTSFKKHFDKIEQITNNKNFPLNDNTRVQTFLCIQNNKFNYHFLEGSFTEGLTLIQDTIKKIAKFNNLLDEHHTMVFYYKIACLYFGTQQNKKCIEYLDKIINNKNLTVREDLMCFARLLNLIAHFELGLDYQVEIQIKSTYKFLMKMNEMQQVQKEIIKFLRKLPDVGPAQIKNEFKKLHQTLKPLEKHPYEKRAFLYLDIISWLESKVQQIPVDEVIREKARKLVR